MLDQNRFAFRLLSFLASLLFCCLAPGQNNRLRITAPISSQDGTIVTGQPAIALAGTLQGAGADKRVLWESSRGFSDLAQVRLADDGVTILWESLAPVALRPGINHLRIRTLGPPIATAFVNVFYTPQVSPKPATGIAIFHGKQITYQVRDGLAIYQGDIILGTAAAVAETASASPLATGRDQGPVRQSITIAPNPFSPQGLWPVVNGVARVPYTITNVSSANTNNINAAIAESNAQLKGVVQWEPATSSDFNLVNFDFDPTNLTGACEAYIGMGEERRSLAGQSIARPRRFCMRWATPWDSITNSRAPTATLM